MEHQAVLASVATAAILLVSVYVVRRPRGPDTTAEPDALDIFNAKQLEPSKLVEDLASTIPDGVILPSDAATFRQLTNNYWAKQERGAIPACIVQPRNAREVSSAVKILKREYDEQGKRSGGAKTEGLFAVRSGGHSANPGASRTDGGVLMDLSLLNEVELSPDGSTVVVGTGARWGDVSKILDDRGLAVSGGRNPEVGVGGLTLGGGISFLSPEFGLVCSNVDSYEVVLASGSVVTASASDNADLWRSLGGGSNNFGIITRLTMRTFPCAKIWSGFLFMPSFQAPGALAAFHDDVNRGEGDVRAAGAMASFSYVQALGMQVIAVHLLYTKPSDQGKIWPAYWQASRWKSFWRFWNTCRLRSVTEAMNEMADLNPPGRRQMFGTTTIKNDPATLTAVHAAYSDGIAPLRAAKIKGLSWTLILQPLLPSWTRKGNANVLGLDEGTSDPLVLVSFSVFWDDSRGDKLIETTTREAIDKMDAAAKANGTSHRFRFLNYCAGWQKPFESYGEKNLQLLRDASRKYDPDGLFQHGCAGGFKLPADGDA